MIYTAFYLMMNAFRTYVIYKFMSLFFEKDDINGVIEKGLYVLFFVIISGVYLVFDIPAVNMVVNIAGLLCVLSIYKESLWKKVLVIVFLYAILLISETIIVVFSDFLDFEVFVRAGYSSVIGLVFMPIIPYIWVLILQNNQNLKKSIRVSKAYWVATILIPTTSMYIIFNLATVRTMPEYQLFIAIGLLLVINIVVFSLYERQNSNFEKIRENELLEAQNKYYSNQLVMIQKLSEETRSIRHDLKNHLMALKGYVLEKDFDGLDAYLERALELKDVVVPHANSGNNLVDSILNYKLQEAESLGVDIEIELQISKQLKIDSFDITVVLGNLLDNALTALKTCESSRWLHIQIIQEKGYIKIAMKNMFSGELIFQNGKLLTSKKEKRNHGIGLSNVKKVVEKYSGHLVIENEKNIFEIKVYMCIPQ